MKHFWILIIFIYACINKESTEKTEASYYYKTYHENELDMYVKAKFNKDSLPIDTSWYYKDSLLQELLFYNTFIYKDSVAKINQRVMLKKNSIIDTSNSYFYNIKKQDENLIFNVGGIFNDSIYLIIGEIDNNYQNIGRVDSFDMSSGKLSILDQSYYKRARIGVMEKIDKNTFNGKEMYVPEKMLHQ